MRRSSALISLLLAGLGCRPAGPPPTPQTQPNLLLLVVDCLRSDHISAHGHLRPTTPSIDDLVARGTSFRHAYSQASWTRPSVPTILSGLYPSEHGLTGFTQTGDGAASAPLAKEVRLVSERLRERGWATALIGSQAQLSPAFGLDRGFDYHTHRAHRAPNIHRRFLGWLDEQDGDRPWFAYLHYLEIHWPYCPPPAIRGHFDNDPAALDTCGRWRQLRDDIVSGKRQLDARDAEVLRARYDEELLELDGHIGGLMQLLEERQELDNTLILLTADHGEEFLERGGIGHGDTLHEEVTSVPLIVVAPRDWEAPAGIQPERLVETRNITPTLLDAAGGAGATDAESLLPWVLGWDGAPRQPFAISESGRQVALRTADWTLIADREGAAAALYDRHTDRAENHDLARERRRDLAAMRDLLAQWQAGLQPAAGTREAVPLDADTARELRALGYLGGADGAAPSPAP